MSFFIRPGHNKRKRAHSPKRDFKTKNGDKKRDADIEIESDEELPSGDEEIRAEDVGDVDEGDPETAQEKKVRLAKLMLEDLKRHEEDAAEDKALVHDAISHRLKRDLDDEKGRRVKAVADDVIEPGPEDQKILNKNGKGHRRSVTCVVISSKAEWVFSAGKDFSIVKWSVASGCRLGKLQGKKGAPDCHGAIVLSLAVSDDDRFLASGDAAKTIMVWNPVDLSLLHVFKGHRGPVHGLAFRRRASGQLFSCAADRCVKVWNCDQMSYVETLFGHQNRIMAIDSLFKERALTVGGTDGSCRVWKIVEESQLVFTGTTGSLDCAAFVNEETWVTGSDEGSLALWTLGKKKPLTQFARAHSGKKLRSIWTPDGMEPPGTQTHWISAVAAMPCSNLVASGSSDGHIRLWKCAEGFKHLTKLKFTIAAEGFVNSLKFSVDGGILVAGLGQEHRLGRWWRVKEARNVVLIVTLRRRGDEVEGVNVKTLAKEHLGMTINGVGLSGNEKNDDVEMEETPGDEE